MGLRFYQTGRLEDPAGRSAEQVSGLGLDGRRLAQEPLHHQRVLDRIVAVVVVEGDEDLLGLPADALDFGQELSQLRLRVEVVVLLAHRGLRALKLTEPALGVAAVEPEDRRGGGRRRHAGYRGSSAVRSAGTVSARGWWPVRSE